MGIYKNIYKLVMAACLGLYATSGYPLALSEAQLKSQLNQLLDVRIELIAVDEGEIDALKISLSQSYENNVSRHQLKYEVLKGSNGNILKISSEDVIREPIVEFTLDIGWSDGHVVREYSFLIDPPSN